jgi:GNAT superfamily N-acetyltransferase
MRASEFTKQELDEKVNPRVVEPGFTAEKRLGNRYVMKAEARYTGEPGDDLRGLIIKVYDTKAKPTMLNWGIGMTRFVARQDPTTQDWYLVSSTTHVDDRYQRQGLASAMYNWARELGNDIEPSSNRTKMGKHFWEKGAGAGREFVDQPPETAAPPAIPTSTAAGPAKAQSLRDRLIKMFTEERVWEQDDSEVKSHDFMAGHCHVMALALKQLHPDWQIRAHVGWDDDAADDTEYRVDHVYTVAPDGTAYDCRGRFDNEQQLVGPDTTGGVDTQYVNFGPEEIKQAMLRGELKRFTKQDLANAMQTATQVGKQDISEAPAGYKEIEFVCVNPQFPDATDPALQKKMYRGLKQIDGVVPLWQEWGDYSEGQASLSAIYQGSKNRDKILSLAKQLGVEVDLEQAVSDDYVDRAMRGEHEGQQGVAENFADGKNPQDKGDSKRHGINTRASVSSLRKTAKQGGRKGQLAHWLANMKSGRAKKK